jgi:lysozyme family protein
MSDMFERSFEMVIEHEGHFSNDPDDRGGATCWGVCHAEINKFLGHVATIEEIKDFPIESAKQIYKKKYWDQMRLDEIKSDLIKMLLFDQGVNRGCVTTILSIERILGVKPNGIMDTETINAINARNGIKLAFDFIKSAQLAYISIVKNNQSQIVFLAGWMRRTHKLLDLVYRATN